MDNDVVVDLAAEMAEQMEICWVGLRALRRVVVMVHSLVVELVVLLEILTVGKKVYRMDIVTVDNLV